MVEGVPRDRFLCPTPTMQDWLTPCWSPGPCQFPRTLVETPICCSRSPFVSWTPSSLLTPVCFSNIAVVVVHCTNIAGFKQR
jgi:hypothetical protein